MAAAGKDPRKGMAKMQRKSRLMSSRPTQKPN